MKAGAANGSRKISRGRTTTKRFSNIMKTKLLLLSLAALGAGSRRRLGTVVLLTLGLLVLPSLALAQDSWLLSGNSGIGGTNFLGTIDTNALELKVNNSRALRLEPGLSPNFIGGYSGNFVPSGVAGATIGGGGQSGQTNQATSSFATVSGGTGNLAGGDSSTVAGGQQNVNLAAAGVIAGGWLNWAEGGYVTIGGGGLNTNFGVGVTIAGGYLNTAGGLYSTVNGGAGNTASGSWSTVAGGSQNTA